MYPKRRNIFTRSSAFQSNLTLAFCMITFKSINNLLTSKECHISKYNGSFFLYRYQFFISSYFSNSMMLTYPMTSEIWTLRHQEVLLLLSVTQIPCHVFIPSNAPSSISLFSMFWLGSGGRKAPWWAQGAEAPGSVETRTLVDPWNRFLCIYGRV